MRTGDRGLMWHGMFLFLIGLVTGLNERPFTSMCMALSAHLEGVMNGTFLIALGAIWDHVELPPSVEMAARWSALYGTYGIGCSPRSAPRWVPPQPTRSCRRAITENHDKKGLRGAFAASPSRSSSPWC
jgi:hypothetical protein